MSLPKPITGTSWKYKNADRVIVQVTSIAYIRGQKWFRVREINWPNKRGRVSADKFESLFEPLTP